MLSKVDPVLRAEARRYRLQFGCESCCHFDEIAGCCSHGYPHEAHLGVRLESADQLVFCKQFELG